MQAFADVNVFKDKVARDLSILPQELKVQELVQANKDVEIVLLGSLRNMLVDLLESMSWRYATAEVRAGQIVLDRLLIRYTSEISARKKALNLSSISAIDLLYNRT
jgi:hypothetical protein